MVGQSKQSELAYCRSNLTYHCFLHCSVLGLLHFTAQFVTNLLTKKYIIVQKCDKQKITTQTDPNEAFHHSGGLETLNECVDPTASLRILPSRERDVEY